MFPHDQHLKVQKEEEERLRDKEQVKEAVAKDSSLANFDIVNSMMKTKVNIL